MNTLNTLKTINYKHLRYFWMVAKTGSIAKAAELLFLTPQSISGQLTEFANLLGIELFRRSGRNLEITDAGKRVLSYADEIFSIGDELLAEVQDQRIKKSLPFLVGIADSVPKTVAYRLLKPALDLKESVRLICREGSLVPLLAELSIHKLDMIIADRPMPNNLNVRGFNHLIGESGVTVFGTASLLKTLKGKFPQCLQNAPFLMVGEDSAIRSELEQWLSINNITLNITGEFEDSALMKSFGQAGAGLFVAPTTIEDYICQQYSVKALGRIETVIEQIYIISTERRLTHPAVKAVTDIGRNQFFAHID